MKREEMRCEEEHPEEREIVNHMHDIAFEDQGLAQVSHLRGLLLLQVYHIVNSGMGDRTYQLPSSFRESCLIYKSIGIILENKDSDHRYTEDRM